MDFYLPEDQALIQVSYSLADRETTARELKALEKASANLKVKELIILTLDQEEMINNRFSVLAAWKWLLAK